MTTRKAVDDFLAQRSLAVVGVSRSGKKFGNMVYRELKGKGYTLFPIHPEAQTLEGDTSYPSLGALPEKVGGLLIVVPPTETTAVVQDAASAGIKYIWMQQGAESEEAIAFCDANGISAVHGECILMFAQPMKFLHKPHRWVWKLLGKLPN
ncbi:MAG: CoA-binding protein [Fidelibacterota bacterium]|nr:MAG: CoA-binding protein [Candidatus Neomarinimicrobiota bacterium]